MAEIQLGVIEARFADMIWEREPVTSSELVKLAAEVFTWKRTTTHTVLKRLCDKGLSGMEKEAAHYEEAVTTLETCGIPREQLTAEKAELYAQLAEINRTIRAERKKLALCQEILKRIPQMEKTIEKLERRDVVRDEHRGR